MGWTYYTNNAAGLAQQKLDAQKAAAASAYVNPYPYGMTGGQTIPLTPLKQASLASVPTPTPATLNSPLVPRAPTPPKLISNVQPITDPTPPVSTPIAAPVSSGTPVGTRNGDYVWRTDSTHPYGFWSYEPLTPPPSTTTTAVTAPSTTTTPVPPPVTTTTTGSTGGSGNNVAADDENKQLLALLAGMFSGQPVQSQLAPNLVPIDTQDQAVDTPAPDASASGPNMGRIVAAVVVVAVVGVIWYMKTH